MRRVHVIQHTHWDFEWYFTRQQARVQFAYHMQEVLAAMEANQIDYYLLDGQMAIVDDYLQTHPSNRARIERLVQAHRLFVGPWYTQIDEMVTSGESIVRNLQLGHQLASTLGAVMEVGYLPDSFGQGADMPKIYQGFGIEAAVFWRGKPKEKDARYFYWTSEDDSTVLVANIEDGYYAGVDLIEGEDIPAWLTKVANHTDSEDLVLPLGGDQRPVDANIKARIAAVNAAQSSYQLMEDTYPHFFTCLAENGPFPTYRGEFVDPSVSKIHRGIYASRADLKQLYDAIENLMVYQVEPMMTIAKAQGILPEMGLVAEIWKAVARGQAHDSSGGCNSDQTNQDIKHRGEVAWQLGEGLRDYLLRKLATVVPNQTVIVWNPTLQAHTRVHTLTLVTKQPTFQLLNAAGEVIPYDCIHQEKADDAVRRRDVREQVPVIYYHTTVALPLTIPPLDWCALTIREGLGVPPVPLIDQAESVIENDEYRLQFKDGALNLTMKATQQVLTNILTFVDSGDEGDNYDYSPPWEDWVLPLTFKAATATAKQGQYVSVLTLKGAWELPSDLAARNDHVRNTRCPYTLTLRLYQGESLLRFGLTVDNQAKDHRLRFVLNTPIKATHSYTDTPFGYLERPVVDPHLTDWRSIGYREEPTALRPFLHFANTHDEALSVSVIGLGEKECELIGEEADQLAITLFRSVGFLGRPDLKRRPGDASGLVMKSVPTPDSQLLGRHDYQGGIAVDAAFSPVTLQNRHHRLAEGELYYQAQQIDRFTTPLTYFPVNPHHQALRHHSQLQFASEQLVVSSATLTPDGTGMVVRVYNPNKVPVLEPGHFRMPQAAQVKALDLNHHVVAPLATNVQTFALAPFKPGEIRTYGIYFEASE